MVYKHRFFSSKCSLLHNSNVFGSCIIHILYTGCAKIKKNNSGTKRLNRLNAGSFLNSSAVQEILLAKCMIHCRIHSTKPLDSFLTF